jgi:hypothetical protein
MPIGEYMKGLLKFAGNNTILFEDHLTTFVKFVEDLEVEYEDIVMKMLCRSLRRMHEHSKNSSLLLLSIDGTFSRRNS